MIRKLNLVLTLIILVTLPLCSQNLDQQTRSYLEKKFSEYAKDYPGVSISVIRGDSYVWKKTAGKSDLENDVAVTSDTKFNIYSTSKYITGLAFLRLVSEGHLSLDQKIRDIDPGLPATYDQITIGHLLTHRSGIRHYQGRKDWFEFASLSPENPREAMQHFINDPLKATPGEKMIYTTYGMVVASHLLEKITGKPFEDAINELVPFSTRLEVDRTDQVKATPYTKRRKGFAIYANLNARSKFGGGAFIASSDQLAEAGQMLFNGKIAPYETIKNLFKAQWQPGETNGTSFGAGAGISSKTFGKPDVMYIAQGGGSPGGRSYLFVVGDLKLSVAITANLEGDGEAAYQLAKDIILKIEGVE